MLSVFPRFEALMDGPVSRFPTGDAEMHLESYKQSSCDQHHSLHARPLYWHAGTSVVSFWQCMFPTSFGRMGYESLPSATPSDHTV